MPRFSIKSRKRVDSLILCWSANCFSSNIAQNLIKKTKLINKWRFLRFIANFVSRLVVNGTAVPKKISRSEQSYRMTGNSQIELCTNVRTNQFEAKGTIFIQWGTKSLPGIVKCNQNFHYSPNIPGLRRVWQYRQVHLYWEGWVDVLARVYWVEEITSRCSGKEPALLPESSSREWPRE